MVSSNWAERLPSLSERSKKQNKRCALPKERKAEGKREKDRRRTG